VVLRGDEVLLILRAAEPWAGLWSVPGGAVELGEPMEEALIREVEEETSLRVEPLALVGVFDRIVKEEGEVRWHYVLVDYLCRPLSGSPRAGTDASEARWVSLDRLDRYDLTEPTRTAIARAVRLRRELGA
jgi:ADP-ribose pyrophosphatase YjhB (NUDIX family)